MLHTIDIKIFSTSYPTTHEICWQRPLCTQCFWLFTARPQAHTKRAESPLAAHESQQDALCMTKLLGVDVFPINFSTKYCEQGFKQYKEYIKLLYKN